MHKVACHIHTHTFIFYMCMHCKCESWLSENHSITYYLNLFPWCYPTLIIIWSCHKIHVNSQHHHYLFYYYCIRFDRFLCENRFLCIFRVSLCHVHIECIQEALKVWAHIPRLIKQPDLLHNNNDKKIKCYHPNLCWIKWIETHIWYPNQIWTILKI